MADRGSDVLLRRCRKPVSEDVVVKLGALFDKHGARCVGWECLGQPAIDAVFGVAHAESLDATVGLLRDILELEPRWKFEIFPKGIPFPDIFELHFKTPGFGR